MTVLKPSNFFWDARHTFNLETVIHDGLAQMHAEHKICKKNHKFEVLTTVL